MKAYSNGSAVLDTRPRATAASQLFSPDGENSLSRFIPVENPILLLSKHRKVRPNGVDSPQNGHQECSGHPKKRYVDTESIHYE